MKKNMNKAATMVAGMTLCGLLFGCGTQNSGFRPLTATEEAMPSSPVLGHQSSLSRQQTVAMMQVDLLPVIRQWIQFADPSVVPAVRPEQMVRQITARIDYAPSKANIQPSYGKNKLHLSRLHEQIREVTSHMTADGECVIRLTGFAAPDGESSQNLSLATNRALQMAEYLKKQFPELKQGNVSLRVEDAAEDWPQLLQLVGKSGKPYSAKVVGLLGSQPAGDGMRKALQALEGGKVWKDMQNSFFGSLRRTELSISYDALPLPAVKSSLLSETELSARFDQNPDQLTLEELEHLAARYRPGTEQYREVYEYAAYRFPDSKAASLNAAAAALYVGDVESADIFIKRADNDPRNWINEGLRLWIGGDKATAVTLFRKAQPFYPRQARTLLQALDTAR